MENASKALIIAGAVLITVMLISLVVYMLTEFRAYKEKEALSTYASQAEAFNRFFVYSNNDFDRNSSNGIQLLGNDVYNIIGKVNDVNEDMSSLDEIEVELDGAIIEGNPKELALFYQEGYPVKETMQNKIYTYEYYINSANGLISKVSFNSYN